jgi:4'-phosphopantetheinyl transferase EntD
MGLPQQVIAKSASGAPMWPKGIVGSLAHDSEIAVAATAMQCDYSSIGVDVEPAEPLDPNLRDVIATLRECEQIGDDPGRSRLLFCIKEAVYKAVYPLDRTFLDHHDVEVDFATGTAVTCSGRAVYFRHRVSTHIVALAFIPAPRGA